MKKSKTSKRTAGQRLRAAACSAFTAVEVLIVLAIIGIILAGVLQPYFESRAYNRLTGAHTTYWDALWLELRVQDQPQKGQDAK